MSLLREYIRAFLVEQDEEVTPGEIGSVKDLALHIDSSRHDTKYVLYNPKYYAQSIKSAVANARNDFNSIHLKGDFGDSFKNYYTFSNVQSVFQDPVGIYGYLVITMGRTLGMRKSCNDANEIRKIAARQGHGTLLYQIAMTKDPPIMPNREDVSDNSEEFWDYFAQEKGSSVDTERFADEKALHKKTSKDCKVHRVPALDQSYALKKPIDLASLNRKHAMFMEQMKGFLMKNEVDFVKTRVEGFLMDAGRNFYERTGWDE